MYSKCDDFAIPENLREETQEARPAKQATLDKFHVQTEKENNKDKKAKGKTQWKPFSELKPIDKDISDLGYNKKYIKENNLFEKMLPYSGNLITGVECFHEDIEVTERKGKVYYRENFDYDYIEPPKSFNTQFGVYNNYNHGEFTSWIIKEEYDTYPEKEQKMFVTPGLDNHSIEGKFQDMFDCGEYVYAISNSMHMGIGAFKIIKIDRDDNKSIIFDTENSDKRLRLRYEGYIKKQNACIVFTNGSIEIDEELNGKRAFQDKIILFKIDESGDFSIFKELNERIPQSNSIVMVEDNIYFG